MISICGGRAVVVFMLKPGFHQFAGRFSTLSEGRTGIGNIRLCTAFRNCLTTTDVCEAPFPRLVRVEISWCRVGCHFFISLWYVSIILAVIAIVVAVL